MSMKKVIKRRHRFYTKINSISKEFDMPFCMVVQLIRQKSDEKRIARKQRRYGYYDDWDTALLDTLGLMVKRC